MDANSRGFGFLKTTQARVLTVLLLAQVVGVFAFSRKEAVPSIRPLAAFPMQVGSWETIQEGSVEKEVMDVLKADDVLSRSYGDRMTNRGANLFVAFFKSQRTGQAPHSPKNCLPGSGWMPSQSDIITISVPGTAPVEANRYVVSKGEDKSLVLYWYQSRSRTVASEYRAKIFLVADAIRYNRTDTALVRVVVPVFGDDVAGATATAESFVRSFYPALRQHLPA
jgi:EpsI family protein